MLDFHVSRSFGGFSLDVEAAIEPAGITALFGHSGCGKSTLLRVIAGLDRHARGHVRFNGDLWQDDARDSFVPAERRGVGYVFQDARLFPHLSVAGNLAFAEKRSRAVATTPTMTDVVDAFDLSPLLCQCVTSLSGGERQRVAIARTLLARPRLLLLDEPLSALDGRRKGDIMPYIAALPARFSLPVIYVTHAVEEVAHLADRMVLMSRGRIVAKGPVADILSRLDLGPLTGRFEAGALLDAQIVGHDTRYAMTRLDFRGQRLLIPDTGGAIGQTVRLRLRARDVSLATGRLEGISIRNQLSGTVREIAEEAETAYAEVLVDVAGAGVRARITRLAVAELGLAIGMPVTVLVKSIALDRPTPAP